MSNPFFDDEPEVPDLDIHAANMRHDREQHSVTMDPSARLRAREFTNSVGARLTDKKIERYRRQGYYSAEFREARRELMQKKALRRNFNNATETFNKSEGQRDGNWLVFADGRRVYSPT